MDKKAKMIGLAQEWKKSGISKVLFAKEHGVTDSSLEYWCRKLRNQTNMPTDTKNKNNTILKPSFIELVSNSQANSATKPVQIEFELANGLRIKIY
jgi:transposase-like protein